MERLTEVSAKILRWVAIIMGLYQLLYTQIMIQDPEGHMITHLGLALVVVILSLMAKSQTKANWSFNLVMLICSLGATVYLLISLDALMLFRSAIPILSDLVIGGLVAFVLLVVNWIVFGKAFPLLTLVSLAYLLLGRYLPPPLTVADVGFFKLWQWVTVEFEGGQGVYGDILQLSAVYLFLFILFGGLLSAFGGTRFIIGLGRWIGSKLSAGPAMVALTGSSLLGTITGSTVANVTITGAFTIPMMKNSGYTPEQAGAIEAVSSNGGQITPPVMGATAFILAGFAGIPYINIVIAAVIPAVIYYFCVFCYIQLTSKKLRLKSIVEPVSGKQLLLDAPIFVVPIGLLVFLLNQGYSLPYVGFWSILAIIGFGLLSSIRKEARLDFSKVVNDIQKSVVTGSQIAVICALIGVVATCIKVSGLGIKLPLVIQDISGGVLLIALFIAMVSSILLGMGVPTAAAYMLVAIGAVPALLGMGVPLLSAHLFCFIFAAFSHITPPVAIGALVAARMAKANYWQTNWEAIKAAFVAFLLPYFIVYIPLIIMKPDAGWLISASQIVSIIVMVVASQRFLTGYCFGLIGLFERGVFASVSVLCAVYVFSRQPFFFVAGAVVFVAAL
ncbi:MAG: TRAP transporter fused permease subunit, partial [Deltaproteobacteria bacterium]|nr:TRAP transporter fused permease subunit [Deltaproteobacteria bacterium]